MFLTELFRDKKIDNQITGLLHLNPLSPVQETLDDTNCTTDTNATDQILLLDLIHASVVSQNL